MGGLLVGTLVFVLVNLIALDLEPRLMWIASHDRQYGIAHLADYLRSKRPHIVFMGGSTVLTGFNPAIAEREIASARGVRLRALNLGIAAGTVDTNYLILKNVISDDKKPDVIVYGLSDFELHPDRRTTWLIDYHELLPRLEDMGLYAEPGAMNRVRFILGQLVPVYRERRLIWNALNIGVNPFDPRHANYRDRHVRRLDGFLVGPERHPPDQVIAAELPVWRRFFATFRFEGPQLARFDAFLRLARRREIPVILVTMPTRSVQRSQWGSREHVAAYLDVVHTIAACHGATVLDLYENPDRISERNFSDMIHFTPRGASALTRAVSRRALIPFFAARAQGEARSDQSGAPRASAFAF